MTTVEIGYVFDNHNVHSTEQHRCLAAAYDWITTERLAGIGVTDGWCCLDVGFGGGSIARWLADRVAPTGGVLATDVKPRELDGPANLTVLSHDIRVDPLPDNAFDVITARLLLQHLPERTDVLGTLVRALKPGGWLQIDEFDTSYGPVLLAPDDEAARLYEKFLTTKTALLRASGGDPEWGRRAAGAMREAGLVDIDPQPYIQPRHAGSADLGLQLHHSDHVRDALRSAGMTEEELTTLRRVLRDPSFRAASSVFYSVQGRKEREG